MATEKITKLAAQPNDPSIVADDEKASNWHIAIDYKNEDPNASEDATDYGSLQIPFSRVAMRDTRGLIPASMLPSYIDDMMYGTYTYTSGSMTMFVEQVSGSTETRTYVSPPSARTGHSDYLEPPENIVFIDTTSDLQYRFIKANETDNNKKYGFAEVPGSRALTPEHGITTANSGNTLAIAVKTPQLIVRSDDTVTTLITNNWCSWNVVQIAPESYGGITCTERSGTGSNKYVELSGIHTPEVSATNQQSWYKVSLQMLAKPTTSAMLSGMIYDVKLVEPDTNVISVSQMDMAGPADTWNVLNFDLVTPSSLASIRLYLTADVPQGTTITAKITNFTVTELL